MSTNQEKLGEEIAIQGSAAYKTQPNKGPEKAWDNDIETACAGMDDPDDDTNWLKLYLVETCAIGIVTVTAGDGGDGTPYQGWQIFFILFLFVFLNFFIL